VFGLYPDRALAQAAASELGGIVAEPVTAEYGEVRPA